MSKTTLVLSTLLLMIQLTTSANLPPWEKNSIIYFDEELNKKVHISYISMEVENAHSSSKRSSFETVKMMLSLYSGESVLATSCRKTNPTDPEMYLFDPKTNIDDSKVRTLGFGPFSAQGYDAKVSSHVLVSDAKYWNSDKMLALPICSSIFKLHHVDGVIGLGYEGAAKDHFTTETKAFAINTLRMSLIFNPDTRKEIRGEPRHHLKTSNGNWQIFGSGKFSVNDEAVKAGDMALLFDMNIIRSHLPKDLYDAFSAKMTKLGLNTPDYFDKDGHESIPYDFLKYPNITISIGDQKLVLEPEDYLEETWGSVKRYNIEPSLDGELQRIDDLIYPVEEKYKNNVIVLGRRFMEKYYTVFDISEGQIMLYDSDGKISGAESIARRKEDLRKAAEEWSALQALEAKEAQQKKENDAAEKAKLAEEQKSAQLKWVALIGVILILVAVVGIFLWKKNQANKLSTKINDQYRVAA